MGSKNAKPNGAGNNNNNNANKNATSGSPTAELNVKMANASLDTNGYHNHNYSQGGPNLAVQLVNENYQNDVYTPNGSLNPNTSHRKLNIDLLDLSLYFYFLLFLKRS